MTTAPLLTVQEVAERLGSHREFVRKELRRKNLRGIELPVGWRVTEDDLQTYIDAHANVSLVRRR